MSSINVTNIKHPSSGSNNVVLDSGGGATFSQITGGAITSGTAQSATGTAVDFTGIPSWVKRITVMFDGVSTNGTSNPLIQIGSGSVTATGYSAGSGTITTAGAASATAYTTGFGISSGSAANTISGAVEITNQSGNAWVARGSTFNSSTAFGYLAGKVSLSGTLDRVRVTTVNGTDAFDAGTINILYEG